MGVIARNGFFSRAVAISSFSGNTFNNETDYLGG